LRGVRSGETKYVEAPGTEWKALYDLGSDPGGSEDLSAGRAAEAGRLSAETARIGGEIPTFPLPLPENLAGPILALGMPATPPASELQLPQDHVDVGNAAVQARRSLQRRMMRSALYLLNDVITADPENYLALMDIAQVSIGIGQLPVAEKNLATLQARYPADGEIYHQLGHLALTEGKPGALERARTFFTTAAALAPLNEEALYDSACAVSGEDPERALDYLERAMHNGFRDFEHIKVDTDMDPLREMERFREITGLDGTAPPGASPVSPASGDPAAAGSR
jgi:tetratricopeptide (TPR) repeat protein